MQTVGREREIISDLLPSTFSRILPRLTLPARDNDARDLSWQGRSLNLNGLRPPREDRDRL
ncbi:MAG: hypothetical protein WB567_09015, partial [Terracidiphilus sp.]